MYKHLPPWISARTRRARRGRVSRRFVSGIAARAHQIKDCPRPQPEGRPRTFWWLSGSAQLLEVPKPAYWARKQDDRRESEYGGEEDEAGAVPPGGSHDPRGQAPDWDGTP